MSGKRLQARAKTVQKLGRDGLVEQNKATGEEKRVSQRAADISFGPDRATEQAAGHRAAQCGSDPAAPAKKKRRKQPRPVQQTAEEAVYAAQAPTVPQEVPAPGYTPSDILLPDTPPPDVPSMRMAADAPMMAAPAVEDAPPPPPVSRRRGKQKNSRKTKQRQAAKHTSNAAHSLDDQPAPMRSAGDAPMQNRPPGKGRTPAAKRPPRPVEGGGRLQFEETDVAPAGDSQRTADSKKQHMRHFAPDAAQPAASGDQHPARLMDDGGGRLHFEGSAEVATPGPDTEHAAEAKRAVKKRQVMDHAVDAAHPEDSQRVEPSGEPNVPQRDGDQAESRVLEPTTVSDDRAAYRKKQARRFTPNAAQPVATGDQHPARLANDGGGRLHFEGSAEGAAPDPDTEQSAEAWRAAKKQQLMDHAANAVQPEDRQQTEQSGLADSETDTCQPDPKAPELPAVPDDRAAYKKHQAAKFAAHSAAPISSERRRLQFEDPPPTSDSPPPAAPTENPVKKDTTSPNRKYDKAVCRVERAEQQMERAREHLPTKRRLSFQPEPDGETGKPRRRLHFEQEVLPEYRPPSLPARAAGMAKTAAVMKVHGKTRESERDNVAVEATHKSELVAEQGVGRVLRWQQDRRRSKPYRALRQAERRAAKENINLAWQTALRDHPELQRKSALTKWIQKQKIKRKYAQAAHEAKQTAQFTQNVVQATGQIVRAIQQYAAAHKSLLVVVALLTMVVVFFAAGMTSCTAMLSGFQSSYISASYMANEQDICDSDLYYTQMETDLQIDIDRTEENYPGYDEYRYNIGEISHNPYELMGYLSTRFDAFTFAQIEAELARLFGEQYRLTREVIVGTRYDSDGNPYSWYVLQTTLTVTPLSTIISNTLPSGEQTDRYNVYQQTLGDRQAYGSPFDFPWLSYVSSGYGWRTHPITGVKDLHRGVDIAVAQGTPIQAIHSGRVISAGDAGDYGLCVVIEDEKGYQSRYAHCSSLSVSAGQEVKRGDVIAAVGSTGDSTGPHLHLEIMLDGEYLNPYYFVETGGGGEVTGPVIPDYSGEPVGSDRFQAMLTEAEKYLGYPYVWGGKSPATSFDCSGYVSWVINHSGWNVGSLGVIGLEDLCTPVSLADAKPGDLVFFIGTYDAPYPNRPTHVGIYVGNGRFIHCGDPISYANINSSYWQQHFYGMGRLP